MTATTETQTMQKKIRQAFGKKVYLLGRYKDGHTFWLEAPSWDCGWYWGFGYVDTYTRPEGPPAKDISCHTHYDGLLFKKHEYYDFDKKCWQLGPYLHTLSDHPDVTECVLTKQEQWVLSDLMQMGYTLKKTAEMYRHGNAYLTTHTLTPELNRPDREKEINEVELPLIFKQIDRLLSPT